MGILKYIPVFSACFLVPMGFIAWKNLEPKEATLVFIASATLVFTGSIHIWVYRYKEKKRSNVNDEDIIANDVETERIIGELEQDIEQYERKLARMEASIDKYKGFTEGFCFDQRAIDKILFKTHQKVAITPGEDLNIGIELHDLCDQIKALFEELKSSNGISVTIFLNEGSLADNSMVPYCAARDRKSEENYYVDGSRNSLIEKNYTYPIEENTDFDYLCGEEGRVLQKNRPRQILKRSYYLKDDLRKVDKYYDSNCEYLYGFKHSHYAEMNEEERITAWKLPYVSLLTVPILSFNNGHRIVRGFVALDSLKPNQFNEIFDVKLIKSICVKLDLLLESIPILKPQEHEQQEK